MSLRWVSCLLWFIFFSSFSHFGLLCIAHQFVLDHTYWILLISGSFLYSIVVDLTVVLVVWLGVNRTLFFIYFVTLAWDILTCISPWMSPEMRLYTLMFYFIPRFSFPRFFSVLAPFPSLLCLCCWCIWDVGYQSWIGHLMGGLFWLMCFHEVKQEIVGSRTCSQRMLGLWWRKKGDIVIGGTVNGDGVVHVETMQVRSEGTLLQIRSTCGKTS